MMSLRWKSSLPDKSAADAPKHLSSRSRSQTKTSNQLHQWPTFQDSPSSWCSSGSGERGYELVLTLRCQAFEREDVSALLDLLSLISQHTEWSCCTLLLSLQWLYESEGKVLCLVPVSALLSSVPLPSPSSSESFEQLELKMKQFFLIPFGLWLEHLSIRVATESRSLESVLVRPTRA